ncbi:retinol dehydrogenase 12 [Biomphalaria pfeifferi]|uniref:Retinol dehydrogenase 12 n=1 Tax=Biomphalaria pfeifferi TaxID=112525 RepID=A0AAD8BHT3_BIOPF|nr:retinol dehydrogenase 12 [Biomphalaria pfeifferi]
MALNLSIMLQLLWHCCFSFLLIYIFHTGSYSGHWIIATFGLTVILILIRLHFAGPTYKGLERLDGKTVLITGANTGIGKETAKEMARRGGRVIMACRDLDKANQAKDEIIKETENHKIFVHKLDLASFKSIREFCKTFNATEERLDILINNAGIMMCPKLKTEDGLEMQIGVNHFGHFLLTNLLLDKLKQCSPSRIVIVSSLMHMLGQMNFDDLNSERNYGAVRAYSQSKLANMLHVRALMKRLEGTGVTVNGLHPGSVDTELQRHFKIFSWTIFKILLKPIKIYFFKNAFKGAQTTIYAALDSSLETVSGKYFSDCKPASASKLSFNDEDAERLWQISEKITQGR